MTTRACATCSRPFQPRGKARYCSTACRCGTDAGYNAGCRCGRCRAAHSKNHKRLRWHPNPHIPALGTHRRVQALARLGWSTAELSRRLGNHRSYFLKVMSRDTVESTTALTVRALYEELCMTPAPDSPAARRTIENARRQGWPPPLAWDNIDTDPAPRNDDAGRGDVVDEIVVARVLAGERLPCNQAEKTEVLRRAQAAGRSLNSIERQMGWNYIRARKGVAA